MRERVWGPVDSDMPYSSYRGMSKSRKNSSTDLAMGAAADPCNKINREMALGQSIKDS